MKIYSHILIIESEIIPEVNLVQTKSCLKDAFYLHCINIHTFQVIRSFLKYANSFYAVMNCKCNSWVINQIPNTRWLFSVLPDPLGDFKPQRFNLTNNSSSGMQPHSISCGINFAVSLRSRRVFISKYFPK